MNYKQLYAKKAENQKAIKALCPKAEHKSGIYCFHRVDENGFRYAYVGLATKSLLSRCADHLNGYEQHIDKSLKAHKLYSEENPCGWKLDVLCYCPPEQCNEKERYYIKRVHDSARQLLNVTSGSQGKGKTNIGQNKPARGYFDGLEQGKKNSQKFIADLFAKHLDVTTKKQPPTKLQEKALRKFREFIGEENNNANDQS